jgi:hypothetical protein
MNIAVVGTVDVDRIWPAIAEGINQSSTRSFDAIPAGNLYQMCRSGNAFLIIAHDGKDIKGASIWQFRQVDQKTVFQGLALTGEGFSEWAPAMRDEVRRIAKGGGAVSLVDFGRPGMKKHFEEIGARARVAFVAYEETL